MERRDFICNSLGTIASLCLAPKTWGQVTKNLSAQDEYFLQLTVPNGWDVLLSTDPWLEMKRPEPAEMFIDYRFDEIGKVAGLHYGPALKPLVKFLDRATVINGIFVSKTSVDHIALRNYMMTGSGSGLKSSASVEYLAQQKNQLAWGLVTDDSSPSGEYTIVKSSVAGLSHLGHVKGEIDGAQGQSATPLQSAIRDYVNGLSLEQTYLKTLKQLRSRNADPEVLRGQIVAAAFKARLSRAAALTINPKSPLNSLDTHTAHEINHMRSLTDVFQQISSLLSTLDQVEIAPGTSLLKRTTVYVSSEFSRSPSLNNSQGKEHNAFTNSVIIMGPRVAGGRVIGGSSLIPRGRSKDGESLHVAQYINPESGQPIANSAGLKQGILIKPETVVANLLLVAGVARDQLDGDLRGEPVLKTLQAGS